MANLVENLTTTAARYAARPALRVGGDTTTYAAFDEQTARVAGLIRSRGLELGDPVGVMLPTSRSSRSSTTACCGPVVSSSR